MEAQSLIASENIKQEPDFEATERAETKNLFFSEKVKLELGDDDVNTGQSEGYNKDIISHVQIADKGKLVSPRIKVDQSSECEEYKGTYSCVQGYLPNTRVEYLKVIPEEKYPEFDKQSNQLDGDVQSENSSSSIVSMDCDASVKDLSRSSHMESRKRKKNTPEGCVSQREITSDRKKGNRTGQAQNCNKGLISQVTTTDNKDKVLESEKLEPPTVCEDYNETYSCVQGYLPNSKVEYLQVIPDGKYLELDKSDSPLGGDKLPENDSSIVRKDSDAADVIEMSGRGSHTEFSKKEKNTYDDSIVQNILTDRQKVNSVKKPFTCDVCGVGFTWQSHLNRHKRTHTGEKPYKCDVCGVAFAQCEHLKDHKRMHTGEKPYKCDMCGVCFTSCTSLKNHIRIHTGEKPYKCDVCGVEFIQNSNLTIHKRIHTKEKPFKCDECGVGFAQRSNLTIHKRIHKGEKPYKCEVCNVEFARCEHLKNHSRIHTGEKPYKCELCAVSFAKARSLKNHKKSIHPEDAV